MMPGMDEHRHHGVEGLAPGTSSLRRRTRIGLVNTRYDDGDGAPSHRHRFSISCDDCARQCTSACDDCVVTHVLRQADEADTTASTATVDGLVLDIDEARVVRMMAHAGLVPDLRFQLTGDTATG
jgi:hypothetical protein